MSDPGLAGRRPRWPLAYAIVLIALAIDIALMAWLTRVFQ